jgi:hypothetical protein
MSQAGNERGDAFFYYNMVALTTADFGAISAIHPCARSCVMLKAFNGHLYSAILVACW